MEKIAEEHWINDNTMSDADREAYVKGFLACAENMHNDEEVLEILVKFWSWSTTHTRKENLISWFEKFKKK